MIEGPYDLRRADELVASTRLNVIEKEHRSFASSIDTRELFALDETPKPHRKKFSNDASVSRVSFGSFTSECGITTPKLPDATAQKETKRSYADEELIWRNKASAPTYFQKRAYDDPTLQLFFASLTIEQKERNKELTRSLLHSIADKHRSDVSNMKEEMDKQQIFHPAANAHRANCIYLLKMHKRYTLAWFEQLNYCSLSIFSLLSIFTEIYLCSITPSNIEDPVLRQLQAELIAKNEAHAAEEEKRRLLFRIVAVGVSCKCYSFIASSSLFYLHRFLIAKIL